MPKKKASVSSSKPEKKPKQKVKAPPPEYTEEEEEYQDEEENNEEEEDEEEEDDDFVVKDDEINEEDGQDDIGIYRDEKKFEKTKRELERKIALKKERGNMEDLEDEKDKKDEDDIGIKEEKDDEEQVNEKMNESDSEKSEKVKIGKKRRLHKARDNKDIYKRELDNLQDDIYEDEVNKKQADKDNSENDIRENEEEEDKNYGKYNRKNKEDEGDDFIEYTHPDRFMRKREAVKVGIETLEQEYITDDDRIIVNADYPERLVTRYPLEELENLSQEIKEEVEWICEQKSYNDFPNKKKKINTLLELFKKDFLDIPYIIYYKFYLFDHEFQQNELWEIFELDAEYKKLLDLKKKVINNFNQLEPFLKEKIYHNMKEKCIDEAKSIQSLKNMMNYINYNKEKYLPKNNNSDDQYLLPVPKSALIVQYNEKLEKYAEQLCLNSDDIASNIELIKNNENLSKLLHPPNPNSSYNDFLQDIASDNTAKSKIMDNICYLISKEMMCHPYIKQYVYDYLRNCCYVTTNPTELGEKQLDLFHPSFRTKRIRERPIKTFLDDWFLDVYQREKERLINITIEIKEDQENSKIFKEIFTRALNSVENNDNMLDNNGYGIKQEKDMLDEDNNYNYNNNRSDWFYFRQSVIKTFLESIFKQFIIDIKTELKEKAENFVINVCAENFEKLLMGEPYIVKPNSDDDKAKKNNEKKKKNKKGKKDDNEEEEENEDIQEENFDETDLKFVDAELPRVVTFIFDPNTGITYGVALDQNGEKIDQKSFNFNFNNMSRSRQNVQDFEDLTLDQKSLMKFLKKNDPNLILIGASDLKCRLIKEQIDRIAQTAVEHYVYTPFGDLSIPEIYANSPISDTQIESSNMYIKQAISLGRYWQSPLDEILQLWSPDVSQNFCLKIKLHPLQKYVDQRKLMEKMELKAVKVVNSCGFDLNRGFDFSHKRNTLMFVSGFGPKKAKAFISNMNAFGKPKTREEIISEKSGMGIGKKLGQSFINFIKIKTNIKNSLYDDDEYNLLDMTRIPIESYDMANKLINDVFKKEEGNTNRKQKKKDNAKIEEIIRHPDKLNILDINEFINKQKEVLKNNELEILRFTIKLIKEELTSPFRDPRKESIELNSEQVFHLLIGDEGFKIGTITVAKVTHINPDTGHVYCKLQNGLTATLWSKDIFDDTKDEDDANERMKALFKPGTVFEAKVKNIEPSKFKIDLVKNPKNMMNNLDSYINLDSLSNFFEIKDEDKLNMQYVNSHSQKNRKYQPRNIKHDKFRNITYTECCNLLQKKDIGECYFRPSSLGNNNLTLSYKFYNHIICHLDIVEEDKIPGENIGKTLKINNETYSSLDEIIKRYVIPCAQLIKESINSRKFVQCDTKDSFENLLKETKKGSPNIIVYNFTILKDYPGYIVLGYIPKANPHYEYIKIKPRGLYFHEQFFPSLEDITNFFKKEYSTQKYRDFVSRAGVPDVQYHRSIESRNNNSINLDEQNEYNKFGIHNKYYNYSMGSSMGKERGSNFGKRNDKLCNICKKPGHFARDCPNKNDFNDKRREGRNNNNYIGGKRYRDNNREHGFKKERYDKGNDYDKDNKHDNWGTKKEKENDDNWGTKKEDDNWGTKKEDDDWGNKKDDDWGSKKDDDWGNKKDDDWGNKKDDDWGIKKEENIGTKKENNGWDENQNNVNDGW